MLDLSEVPCSSRLLCPRFYWSKDTDSFFQYNLIIFPDARVISFGAHVIISAWNIWFELPSDRWFHAAWDTYHHFLSTYVCIPWKPRSVGKIHVFALFGTCVHFLSTRLLTDLKIHLCFSRSRLRHCFKTNVFSTVRVCVRVVFSLDE